MSVRKDSELRDRLARRYGLRVLSGPFSGMKYLPQSIGSELLPKLLGSYERELHDVIEGLLARPRKRVINIGCGEGYYAVGLALRWPETHVHAFDTDPKARQLCQELARLNAVSDRVSVHGACTVEQIQEFAGSDSLVVCDCEGNEIELLRPDRASGLEQCELLVEFHDCFNPLISRTIAARFAATHSIGRLPFAPRSPALFVQLIQSVDSREHRPDGEDWLAGWTEAERRLALDENRPVDMEWGYLSPSSDVQGRQPASRPRVYLVGPSGAVSVLESANDAISACILAYNEEKRIEEAIQCLQGWTDQIIVIDNESQDRTAEIARRYTEHVLTAPRVANFDALRNLAIEVATGRWLFYLDADERVPPRLGELLRRLVRERGDEFEAFHIAFRHHFCGKWIQHSGWWPGYKAPQLLKKGHFRYNERVHGGAEVFGHRYFLPADDLDLTMAHYSYDDLSHYLAKINPYTDAEAESLRADGALHSWQAQLAHFVHDWQLYYERGQGYRDGMHGFVLAFLAGVYRFLSRAKLWLLRSQQGELIGPEPVPSSAREVLEFMARVAQEGADPWLGSHVYPVEATPGRTAGQVPSDWYMPSPAPDETPPDADRTGRRGITACIVARNAERQIEGALRSLLGWTDQIVVVDGQSEDRTAEIARRYTDRVLTAPDATHSAAARASVADAIHEAAFAIGDWLFYLNADERVSPQLAQALQTLVREHGDDFDAVCVPIRNHFYGQWMQSAAWWPGYDTPRLLKQGTFQYGSRPGDGIEVQGRLLYLPASDPAYAIHHYASEGIADSLAKLNRDTDLEAEFQDADGEEHSWQAQLAHFVRDWQVHYDHGRADQDGMHGFVQSFLGAFHGFMTRAKIWDRRRQRGEVSDQEPVPGSLREMLGFMAQVASGAPASLRPASPPTLPAPPAEIPSQHDAILLQCAMGDHIPLMELTRERHEAYARAHGMDYLCHIGPKQSERHPCWDKIPILLEVLRHGRHREIFWLDADALIVDMQRDLREALPEGCWLGMVHHGDPLTSTTASCISGTRPSASRCSRRSGGPRLPAPNTWTTRRSTGCSTRTRDDGRGSVSWGTSGTRPSWKTIAAVRWSGHGTATGSRGIAIPRCRSACSASSCGSRKRSQDARDRTPLRRCPRMATPHTPCDRTPIRSRWTLRHPSTSARRSGGPCGFAGKETSSSAPAWPW